jgi:hypothetical protein
MTCTRPTTGPGGSIRHALFCLCRAGGFSPRDLTEDRIAAILEESAATAERVFEAALSSRRKDYENPFRAVTYRNSEEMRIVLGDLENNAFLEELRLETKNYRERIRRLVRIIKQRKET